MVKWWLGLVSGVSAIALGGALKIMKLAIVAGWATECIAVSLGCLALLVVGVYRVIALAGSVEERSDQQKKSGNS
jgi:hypothetical protein